jgi:hypothetical protein
MRDCAKGKQAVHDDETPVDHSDNKQHADGWYAGLVGSGAARRRT